MDYFEIVSFGLYSSPTPNAAARATFAVTQGLSMYSHLRSLILGPGGLGMNMLMTPTGV